MWKRTTIAWLALAMLSPVGAGTLWAATLTIGWDASPDASGYVIRYGTRGKPLSASVEIGSRTIHTLTDLIPNQVYCFAVHARSASGLSDPSNEVCALVDPPPGLPTINDFNADNRFDLMWQHHASGHVSTWTMSGTTMTSGVLMTPSQVPDTNWKVVGRGDLNRDGHVDLVWHHESEGWVSTWLMNGTTMISGVLLSPQRVADTNWRIVGVADGNGDGHPDLYWHHRVTGMVSVWLMNGTSLVEGLVLAPERVEDTNWNVAAVGDMNGDGHPDLVWQHAVSGLVSTWFMRGSRMIEATLLNPSQVADLNWKIRALGDVDADGQTDLVWQHQVTGVISTWLMNGASMKAAFLLTPSQVPDTNWKIAR
jgi:hypothetical protein